MYVEPCDLSMLNRTQVTFAVPEAGVAHKLSVIMINDTSNFDQ